MNSSEIRRRFLAFFEKRGHKVIPSASLVPENDPSVLFNTAGMQPLVPYLLGEEHPMGKRLVDIQKCVRTGDIDDVGDNRHLTFFEMMGNWSLGDYFKEDAIKWSYEFLTSKEEGLGLDPKRLYVTIFEGDENTPLDEESKKIWMSLGIPEHRIYPLGADDNWWSAGDNGPCGPDSEMFYDMEGGLGDLTKEAFIKAVQDEKAIEIWNDVFMEFVKKDGKVAGKLDKKNVDTGAGLERMTAVMQGVRSAYDTDIFAPIISEITNKYGITDEKAKRIVADHSRTAVFMIGDGVLPSNTDRGYVLRRLIRRAIFQTYKFAPGFSNLYPIVDAIINSYKNIYANLDAQRVHIHEVFEQEEIKFMKTLEQGTKETKHYVMNAEAGEYKVISGKVAFDLFQSHGFPIELTQEIASQHGVSVDMAGAKEEMRKHQNLSRAGAEQKFKGGLADTSEMSVKYHTATHLLHQALYDVLGPEVGQKGSNITPERLRFDFSFPRKMTDEEKKRVEDIVNDKIQAALPVQKVIMPKAEAEKTGARHFFGEKYPDEVSVYFIGDSLETAYSKEFCGGPHISNTSELASTGSAQAARFKIQKEEAVSAGVRRIKAVLE